ncbi:MAG: hypothetical protein WAK61_15030 [Leclercia sp.]
MKKELFLLSELILLAGCHAAPKTAPTQVVYRFDDHRYLELEGFNCEGALWYNDTQRNIRSEVVERDSPIFRISFFKYVHPSEKYISIPWDDLSGLLISKNYGQTWGRARFAPAGGALQYGASGPESGEVESFTVVNDQAFIQTKSGDLYMSSKPFDDPRLQHGGAGIPYTYRDYDGSQQHARLKPGSSGLDWGREYTSWNSVNAPDPWITFAYKPNWQNIPNKVPEVKNYTGWDRMQCNPDLGQEK